VKLIDYLKQKKPSRRARKWIGLVLVGLVCGVAPAAYEAELTIPMPAVKLQVAFALVALAIGIHEFVMNVTPEPASVSIYVPRILLIAAGLMIVFWGLSILKWHPLEEPFDAHFEPAGGTFYGDVIEDPTAWEIIRNIVTGPIGLSFAAIIATFAGFVLALMSTLSLLFRKGRTTALHRT
jgi:hypothetical protein